jgi:hypothetical protein
MTRTLEPSKASVRSPEQRAADELIRLITKLRWMGLEEEADCIERQVSSLPVRGAESGPEKPRETD